MSNLQALTSHSYTIIDEADEMLHDDWGEEMSKIMGGAGKLSYTHLPGRLTDFLQTLIKMVTTATSCSLRHFPSEFAAWLPNTLTTIISMSALAALALCTSMSSNMYAVTVCPMLSSLADQIQIMWADPDKKMKALYDLLISMPPSRTLVFVRSKKTADFVDDYLFNLGLPSTSIHSDRTQSEREDAL